MGFLSDSSHYLAVFMLEMMTLNMTYIIDNNCRYSEKLHFVFLKEGAGSS